jgi:hypothetical protein
VLWEPHVPDSEPRGVRQLHSSAIPETIDTHFTMIWFTITSLTTLLALADILLSIFIKHPTAAAQQSIAMCDTFAKVGFGGIFGMIGAKALK